MTDSNTTESGRKFASVLALPDGALRIFSVSAWEQVLVRPDDQAAIELFHIVYRELLRRGLIYDVAAEMPGHWREG